MHAWRTATELVKLLDFTEDQINLDRIPVCIQMVLPEIHSTINDISAAAGLRGTILVIGILT
jgi:hypothetical protein